jgi:hypothetical protein
MKSVGQNNVPIDFVITRQTSISGRLMVSDAKEGKMTKEGRARFLIFFLVGTSIVSLGLLIMITYLIHYS